MAGPGLSFRVLNVLAAYGCGMCGIAGAFRLDGSGAPPLPVDVLHAMNDVMAYRGPDDAGYVSGDGCSLGARRLSIIDVEGGHQPFANESERVWAAQNGEIYNHATLRRELEARGHVLRSRCDTEVLPHLYEEHGPALAERLRGMFAVAVWDRAERRGVLIRDRLGIKPLYYAVAGDVVVFGSELKCVLASGLVSDELDPDAIAAYLMLGYVPGAMTPLRDVRKLEAGERLVVSNGRVTRRALVGLPRSGGRPHALGGGVGRGPARQARRVRAPAPDERRPPGRDVERRPGLEPDRRSHGAAHERAGEDVRGRLRRRGLGASGRQAGGRLATAPTTTSWSWTARRALTI